MIFAAMMWTAGVCAQTAEPTLDIEFEETEAVPGQALTLRLTVLVPTFMPSPPDWPTFETPNLLVHLPSKASTPTSKKIDGETWSGITRRYQISPIVAGDFTVPESVVRVQYRGETGDEVIVKELPVPALQVRGVVPDGAAGLDPFLAAQSLTLTQHITGDTQALAAGGSFAREIQVTVTGVSAMFLPPLTPDSDVAGLRSYPESPVLEDKDTRGVVSGLRTEKTVYVAEAAVDGALPEVQVTWFNLDTGKLETATLAPVSVHADAPPAAAIGPTSPQDLLRFWPWAAGLIGAAIGVLSYRRWGRDRWAQWRNRRQAAWLASEKKAWRDMQQAVAVQDLAATRVAYDIWCARLPVPTSERDAAVKAALVALGRAQFQSGGRGGGKADWQALGVHLKDLRITARYHQRESAADLPQLNPTQLAS